VNRQLLFLGIAMLVGSVLTVVAIAGRRTAPWSPYVLALTSGALVLFIALVAEPAAEPLKPIPPIARAIDANRRPGDTVAIGGVSGGNGLIFYTLPPVRDIKNNAGFVSTVCTNGGVWVVTRPQDAERFAELARSLRRSAEIVMEAPSALHPRAALIRVAGPACAHD